MQLSRRQNRSAAYLLAISGAVVLSWWAVSVQYVPNPDALTYLTAAENFLNGRFEEGFELYRWPAYSLLIAALAAVTGWPALLAAHVLNAILFTGTVVFFVALVEALGPKRWGLLAIAAVVILLHPRLLEMRSSIVRDHGYHAFFLSTLLLVALEYRSPGWQKKLAIAASIGAATLFRIEGLFLALLVPGFLIFARTGDRRVRWAVAGGLGCFCLLLVPGFLIWAGVLRNWITGEEVDTLAYFMSLVDRAENRMDDLRAVLPGGKNTGEMAYFGTVLMVLLYNTARALTPVLAVLAVIAYCVRRFLPAPASPLIAWFALWQLPLLLVFVVIQLYLDWRYAMGFSLAMSVAAVFAVAGIIREWRQGRQWARISLPVVVIALAIAGAESFPKPTRLGYLKSAGEWVAANLPAGAEIATNDARIALFSHRAYPGEIRQIRVASASEIGTADFAVLVQRVGTPPPEFLAEREATVVARGFEGETVIVYDFR